MAVQGLNVVRVISLFYLGQWNTQVFNFAHEYLWQALIMLDVLIVWLLWIRAGNKAAPSPASPDAARLFDGRRLSTMRKPSPFVVFVASAFGWMLALTVLWTQISPWTSYPVGVISSVALEQGAPMWVREVRLKPGVMDVDTRVAIPVPSAGGRRAEVTIDVNPARYAYGLPIFLALLLAARGPGA